MRVGTVNQQSLYGQPTHAHTFVSSTDGRVRLATRVISVSTKYQAPLMNHVTSLNESRQSCVRGIADVEPEHQLFRHQCDWQCAIATGEKTDNSLGDEEGDEDDHRHRPAIGRGMREAHDRRTCGGDEVTETLRHRRE